MRKRVFFLAVMVLSGILGAGPAAGQDKGERSSRGRQRPGGERGPEDRQRMYDHVAEHQLRHFASDYELTAEQQDLVRARLDRLKVEQSKYMEPLRQEYQDLERKMHESFSRRRDRQEANTEEATAARERLREIWSGSPLMNPERAAEAIEQILPDQQVEKGRLRKTERSAEIEQRYESWRQGQGDRGQHSPERGSRERGTIAGSGDSWDRYVESFTRLYQLDQAQQASAQSVLREMKQQRDTYRESRQTDFDALGKIEDRQARREAYEKLNQPVDWFFEQLKERLMRIPTNAQRSAAGPLMPASRPAATTAPAAGSTSRPFGDRSDRRGRSRRGG